MATSTNMKEYYERRLEEINNKLAMIESYGEDDFEDGAVLVFDKVMGNQTYKYAAIKAVGLWYTTGPKSPKAYTWDELVSWFSEGTPVFEVWYVSELKPLN